MQQQSTTLLSLVLDSGIGSGRLHRTMKPSRSATRTPQERLEDLAAYISGNLEEFIQMLPPRSDIASDARKLADKLDRRFKLVRISCPVGIP
jgi:hypothetical protein